VELAADPIVVNDEECSSWDELLWGMQEDGHWCANFNRNRQWVADVLEPISTRKKTVYSVYLGAHVPRYPFDRSKKASSLVSLPYHRSSLSAAGGPVQHPPSRLPQVLLIYDKSFRS
jgi:hypothetical protein